MTTRNRFYKKVFLTEDSIAPDSDTWKNKNPKNLETYKILDDDGTTEIDNKLEFPTNLTTIVISLDNDDRILEYSFDGRNLDGEIFCDDGPFSQDCASEGYLYLRLPEGTTLKPNEKIQARIWAWRGGVGK